MKTVTPVQLICGAATALLFATTLFAQPTIQTRDRSHSGGGMNFGRVVVCDAPKIAAAIGATIDHWVGLVGRWNELQAQVVESAGRLRARLAAIRAEQPRTADQFKAQCDRLAALRTQVDKLLRVDTAWVPKSRQLRLVAEGFGKVAWKTPAIKRRVDADVSLYRTESAAIEGAWVRSDGQTNYDLGRWNRLVQIWQKNQLELDPATGNAKRH